MNENNKLRVALYYPLGNKKTEWTGGGGAQRRLSFLFSHMDKEKVSSTLVFRVYGDKDKAKERLASFIDPSCELVIVSNNFEAFQHFLKEKYDCVAYANQMAANLPIVYASILARSKRLLILVTISYSQWKFNNKLQEILMRNNIFLSNRIDCLYPKETEQLRQRFPGKNVTATPCSLPNLRSWLEISKTTKKDKIMVFASRMIEEKNPKLLLDAVDLIKDEFLNSGYIIKICGDGPLEENIKKRLSSGWYGESVQFLGRQDMLQIVPQGRVFFSLQENENYPSQSLLEAISCGCFCIATDCGDTGRIVKEEFGMMVPKNAQQLAKAILHSISLSDEQYREIENSAKQFAEKTFDPQNAIHHYMEICGELSQT